MSIFLQLQPMHSPAHKTQHNPTGHRPIHDSCLFSAKLKISVRHDHTLPRMGDLSCAKSPPFGFPSETPRSPGPLAPMVPSCFGHGSVCRVTSRTALRVSGRVALAILSSPTYRFSARLHALRFCLLPGLKFHRRGGRGGTCFRSSTRRHRPIDACALRYGQCTLLVYNIEPRGWNPKQGTRTIS